MLPLAIRLAALVPVLAGGGGALFGPAFLGEAGGPATSSQVRYLSGLLLGIGLLAWWCAAALPRRAGVFGVLCAIVTLGGLARLCGLAVDPLPPWPHLAALVMELGVVPALWFAAHRTAACGQSRSAQGS
ncbi:DUF4345 domain-containing protein [Roseomonas sp. CAU 1739]|uniref:DUF4345 domain-containing protein n=1 Tax=Roseomonas sp. CAU 1739 TaxID=3140364 RepID=UPI00325BC03F